MKIATVLLSLSLAAPAFACPNMDHDTPKTEAPRTADKDKAADKAKDANKPAEKPADKDKSKDTAKKPEPKPGDKVSSR